MQEGQGRHGGAAPGSKSATLPATERLFAAPPGEPRVEIRRSARRFRTASARVEGDTVVVMLPEGLPAREERRLVAQLVSRVQRRRSPVDDDLKARAEALSERFLGGHARPISVQWVDTMGRRWGSCTPANGTIRLSRRAADFPDYVVDYLILHELTHLLVAGHGPDFWTLLRGYPKLERARGFLDGAAVALPRRGESE